MKRLMITLALAAIIGALGLAAWLQRERISDFIDPAPPPIPADWTTLVQDLKAWQRGIGFRDAPNFARLEAPVRSLAFCGHAPQAVLPWSYQDPVIRWPTVQNEAECLQAAGPQSDVYFGVSDALGEAGMQVTPAMLTGSYARFVYLIIHEDCHDQFDLPHGIEEPLCDVIAYHGMGAWSRERFGRAARESRVLARHAQRQIALTAPTLDHYARLEALYARLARKEITLEALLPERQAIYASAMRALDWQLGELNNVSMANYVTYSRHYPALEALHLRLGGDLARTVAFFQRVDQAKPDHLSIVKRHQLEGMHGTAFVRAYETGVLETAARLAATGAGANQP
jgi:hypothetical protein